MDQVRSLFASNPIKLYISVANRAGTAWANRLGRGELFYAVSLLSCCWCDRTLPHTGIGWFLKCFHVISRIQSWAKLHLVLRIWRAERHIPYVYPIPYKCFFILIPRRYFEFLDEIFGSLVRSEILALNCFVNWRFLFDLFVEC